jgi:uncharacterized protein YqgQ
VHSRDRTFDPNKILDQNFGFLVYFGFLVRMGKGPKQNFDQNFGFLVYFGILVPQIPKFCTIFSEKFN